MKAELIPNKGNRASISASDISLMLFLGACEPMDDVYEEINSENTVEGVAEYTLTSDDYETLELENENFVDENGPEMAGSNIRMIRIKGMCKLLFCFESSHKIKRCLIF